MTKHQWGVIAARTSAEENAKTSPVSLSIAIVCSRASAVFEPQASVTSTGHRLRSKPCVTRRAETDFEGDACNDEAIEVRIRLGPHNRDPDTTSIPDGEI